MNSDKSPENIPSQLFDWIQDYSFAELNVTQQQEVLQYISEQTYLQLHHAAMKLAQRKSSSKTAMMGRFDEKHRPKGIQIVYTSTFLWKAAAVLILFSFMALQYFVFIPQKQLPSSLISSIDTVYITKTIQGKILKVHDTIFLNQNDVVDRKQLPSIPTRKNHKSQGTNKNQSSGLHVVTIHEMSDMPNNRKGESIKDDSLLNSFTFIGS